MSRLHREPRVPRVGLALSAWMLGVLLGGCPETTSTQDGGTSLLSRLMHRRIFVFAYRFASSDLEQHLDGQKRKTLLYVENSAAGLRTLKVVHDEATSAFVAYGGRILQTDSRTAVFEDLVRCRSVDGWTTAKLRGSTLDEIWTKLAGCAPVSDAGPAGDAPRTAALSSADDGGSDAGSPDIGAKDLATDSAKADAQKDSGKDAPGLDLIADQPGADRRASEGRLDGPGLDQGQGVIARVVFRWTWEESRGHLTLVENAQDPSMTLLRVMTAVPAGLDETRKALLGLYYRTQDRHKVLASTPLEGLLLYASAKDQLHYQWVKATADTHRYQLEEGTCTLDGPLFARTPLFRGTCKSQLDPLLLDAPVFPAALRGSAATCLVESGPYAQASATFLRYSNGGCTQGEATSVEILGNDGPFGTGPFTFTRCGPPPRAFPATSQSGAHPIFAILPQT